MNCGIYRIRNIENNNAYIGQSVCIPKRWKSHKYELNKKTHGNKHLQAAWDKYGENNFVFEILCYCDPEMLTFYEQSFVDGLNPEYNIRKECVDSNKGLTWNCASSIVPEKYKGLPGMIANGLWECEKLGFRIDIIGTKDGVIISIHGVKLVDGVLVPVDDK